MFADAYKAKLYSVDYPADDTQARDYHPDPAPTRHWRRPLVMRIEPRLGRIGLRKA